MLSEIKGQVRNLIESVSVTVFVAFLGFLVTFVLSTNRPQWVFVLSFLGLVIITTGVVWLLFYLFGEEYDVGGFEVALFFDEKTKEIVDYPAIVSEWKFNTAATSRGMSQFGTLAIAWQEYIKKSKANLTDIIDNPYLLEHLVDIAILATLSDSMFFAAGWKRTCEKRVPGWGHQIIVGNSKKDTRITIDNIDNRLKIRNPFLSIRTIQESIHFWLPHKSKVGVVTFEGIDEPLPTGLEISNAYFELEFYSTQHSLRKRLSRDGPLLEYRSLLHIIRRTKWPLILLGFN